MTSVSWNRGGVLRRCVIQDWLGYALVINNPQISVTKVAKYFSSSCYVATMERCGEENIFIVAIQEPRQFPPQALLVAVTERKESIVVSGIIIKGSPATVHWSELTV